MNESSLFRMERVRSRQSENQRARQRLDTRNRLLELAIDEFRACGIDKAKIRDIVEKAGVVPGTFYFHFPTKDHVLLEFGQRIIARFARALPGSAKRPPRLSSVLRALAAAPRLAAEEVGDPELLRATISIFQRPPVATDFDENPILEVLSRSVAAEMERGEIENDLAPVEISRIILMAFFGTLLAAPGNPTEQAKQVRRMLGFFENALLCRSACK